jgi:hypothetical protein
MTDREAFDGKLEFDISVIPYTGNDAWIEPALIAARQCLDNNKLPFLGADCDYCKYRQATSRVERSTALS